MKDRSNFARSFVFCLLGWFLAFAGCSYTTNFVIVNRSSHPVEVRYRIKKPVNPIPADQILTIVPAVKPISQLNQQTAWRDLSASEYQLDSGSRIVVTSLMPGWALRIENRNLSESDDEYYQSENFSVEEINVSGASGGIQFRGDEARKAFVRESKSLYTLTYK